MTDTDQNNRNPHDVVVDRIGYRTDLEDIPDEIFDKALEWQPHFEKHLEIAKPTAKDAKALAAIIGLGITRTYEYIAAYREFPDLVSLMPKKPTGGRGKSRLDPVIDHIITEVIEEVYENELRNRPYKVVQEVHRRCYRAGLKKPSPTTVRSRIAGRNIRDTDEAREGKAVARAKHDMWRAHFPTQMWPLSMVQYDHTKMDIEIVDFETGKPIGRPFVTIGYDVYTKCVVGILISMSDPTSLSVGLCIHNTAMPKGDWLTGLGIDTNWPMYGKPDNVHFDNGTDFRSKAVARACAQHKIGQMFRALKKAEHGAGVERQFRTLMTEIQQLDGTTFSNTIAKRKYDSEGNAIFTLREVERIVISFITKQYHERSHSENPGKLPPRKMWEIGIYGDRKKGTPGRGLPLKLANPRRFLIDFLPQERRTIHQEGIVWDYIWYMDDVLSVLREKGKRFIVKRDPRDISVIFLMDQETGEYFEIPYKDLSRPPITAWEHQASLKLARERLAEEINEDLIFEGVEEIRGITKEARDRAAATKKKRRSKAKTDWSNESTKSHPTATHHLNDDLQDKINSADEDFEIDFNDTYEEIETW